MPIDSGEIPRSLFGEVNLPVLIFTANAPISH